VGINLVTTLSNKALVINTHVAEKGTPVDGFGSIGASWPKGLGEHSAHVGREYWSETAVSGPIGKDSMLVIRFYDDKVSALLQDHKRQRRAVCVPKSASDAPGVPGPQSGASSPAGVVGSGTSGGGSGSSGQKTIEDIGKGLRKIF